MYFVYIIHSKPFDIYYKGESERPYVRLEEHNSNKSRYTTRKGPWKLVYLEEFPTRREAIIREKMLKKQNRKYIEWVLTQPCNKLNSKE